MTDLAIETILTNILKELLKELVNAEDEIETDTIMPIFSDLDLVESVSVYRLTDKGREFLGVLRDMQEGE